MERFNTLTRKPSVWLAGVAMSVGLAGCATTEPPAPLQQAKNMYQQAASDQDVSRNASVALFEAENALQQAMSAWEDDQDEAVVDHLAYLAQQRVQIAEAQAQQRTAQQQVANLTQEREQLLISLREQEAQTERQRAQQAREEAEMAKMEIRRLEESLSQLQATTQETSRGTVVTLGDVLFPFDQAELKPGIQRNLMPLADFLKDNPQRDVVVEGHTDAVGDPQYNQQLSQSRADSVKTFLIQQGIDPRRVATRGLGESFPVANNETPAGRQQNRRVDIVIRNTEGDTGQVTGANPPTLQQAQPQTSNR